MIDDVGEIYLIFNFLKRKIEKRFAISVLSFSFVVF